MTTPGTIKKPEFKSMTSMAVKKMESLRITPNRFSVLEPSQSKVEAPSGKLLGPSFSRPKLVQLGSGFNQVSGQSQLD